MEKGQEGTLHIQGMLRTTSVRFAQVKKALPRAHIEAAKNATALAKYVVKPESRVSSIPTVRTATQADVQRMVYHHVLDDCYRMEKKRWGDSFDILKCNENYLLDRYTQTIRKHWESYMDDAVRDLIKQQYYGIEFVMANPQVRTAFRKYIVEICYRFINAPHPQASSPPQDDQAASSNDPQETPTHSI